MQKISIIINLGSKQADQDNSELISVLAKIHDYQVEVLTAHAGSDLHKLTEEAIANGAKIIVAGGGDGTISTIAQHLAFKDHLTLGILPLGTHNNFAKDLGIPEKIEDAMEIITSGIVEKINLGEVNGHYFVNNSSIGLYPRIVLKREQREMAGVKRLFAFSRAVVSTLINFKKYKIQINSGNIVQERISPMVFVGNGDYNLNTVGIAKRRKPGQGRLSLILFKNPSRLGLISIVLKDFLNLLQDDKNVEQYFLDKFQINTPEKQINVACDGEIALLQTPLVYSCHRNAMNILKSQ